MAVPLAAVAMTFMLAQASDSVPVTEDASAVIAVHAEPGWQRYVPVAASIVVPGSGQIMQGEWLKGLLHLGIGAAFLAASQYGNGQIDPTWRLIGGVGLIGIGVWSPWDAYLHAAPAPAETPTP
jgi:hypothetical protein